MTSRWNKLMESRIVWVLLVCIVAFAAYKSFQMYQNTRVLSDESQAAEKKIQELTLKKKELEDRIRALTSKEAVERKAKEEFNLKLPGEEVVVVVPDASAANTPPEPSKNFFIRIWEYIRNLF